MSAVEAAAAPAVSWASTTMLARAGLPGRANRPAPTLSGVGGRVNSELARFAEDPEFYLEPPEGAERFEAERYCLTIGSRRRWAGVCRLRLPDERELIASTVHEIIDLVEGVERVVWNVGPSSGSRSLPDELRSLGLRDPDLPLEPLVAAMILTNEPPSGGDVEVRRIASIDDHLAGLEILLASDTWTPEWAMAERASAEETYEKRMRRGGMQWLALQNGLPVAYAGAERGPMGLYLAGGATLPHARGGGCYRALVRARWEEAARLGLQGLAVQAQYGSSAPILRRLGFLETASITTLQS